MEIKKVTDKEFAQYGRVLDAYYDFNGIIKEMENYDIPEDVVYVPSVEALETGRTSINLKMRMFGEMPIQIGYCNGKNTKLNAVEYHRSSEVDIEITDLILQVRLKRFLLPQEPELSSMRLLYITLHVMQMRTDLSVS